MGRKPYKITLPVVDLDSMQYMVLQTNMSQPPNGISIGSAISAQLIHAQHTDRQTDTRTTLRATSVAIGRIYALKT